MEPSYMMCSKAGIIIPEQFSILKQTHSEYLPNKRMHSTVAGNTCVSSVRFGPDQGKGMKD
jgi:hypothetical protein